MRSDYLKKRRQLRLNALVASLFLLCAAFLAILYGSTYLSVFWVVEKNYAVAVASFALALGVAVLCVGLWLRIIMKLRRKLVENDAAVADVDESVTSV